VIADRIRPQCVMAPLGDGDEQNAGSDELGDNVVDGGMAGERVEEARVPGGGGEQQQDQENPDEDPAVRATRDPGEPTPQEREKHSLTHLPFRPWCQFCVQGRARGAPHVRRRADDAQGIAKVSLDYGFLTDAQGGAIRTVLVLKARPSGMIAARIVDGKGRADGGAAAWVVDQLRRLGENRCVLQADGEPAQRTFIREVIEEAVNLTKIGVASAHSAPHDHQSNGDVECAIRELKAQVRVMKLALEARVGSIALKSKVLDWLVSHAGELLSGASVGRDGFTAVRRVRGKNWTPELIEFGELVQARRPRALEQPAVEARWDKAVYLGTTWGSIEHYVGMENGSVAKVRSLRRVPAPERWSIESIIRIAGTPKEPEREADAEHPELPPAPAEVIPFPEDERGHQRRQVRDFKITRENIEEHGYTRSCPKCDAIRSGRQVGTGHSQVCRQRFRAALEEAGDGRVGRARDRKEAVDVEMREDDDMEEFGPFGQEAPETPRADGLAAPETPRADGGAAPGTPDTIVNSDMEEEEVSAHDVMNLRSEVVDAVLGGAGRDKSPVERVRAVCLVQGLSDQATGHCVSELFSPPRVNGELRRMRDSGARPELMPGTSFDLQVDQRTGESWDFTIVEHRRRCWTRLKEEDPWLIIGSPPCTDFSALNVGLNHPKMENEEVRRRLVQAHLLLNFALDVYRWQMSRGKYFLHEHPNSATSWKSPAMQDLLTQKSVCTTTADACRFGMTALDHNGAQGPVKKPTRWASNAPLVLEELGLRCEGRHPRHVRLLGGRAAQAAIYPPELIAAIISGIHRQRVEDCRLGKAHVSMCESLAAAVAIKEEILEDSSGERRSKDVRDEYTGQILPPALVTEARREELTYFESKGVWTPVPRARAHGKRVYGTRWVNSNKKDEADPEIRCRLVCQEVNRYATDKFFASTPPLEAMRLIMSIAAESRSSQLRLLDISRAYFNAPARREVYVELPPEAGYGRGYVGLLNKAMYGTRDAAQSWEQTYGEALEQMGFTKGLTSPCVAWCAKRNLAVCVHGDDFFAAGSDQELNWLEKDLFNRFEGKAKGVLRKAGDELRLLNRVVRRTAHGYEWEGDQRHSELLVRAAGLGPESKPLSAPSRKLSTQEAEEGLEPLNAEEAGKYREAVARANFLSADRPDISYAVKELCRSMSAPTSRDDEALKRLSRYLLGRPRMVMEFVWQEPMPITVYTDSDWAGCLTTRKSTSGGALMRGTHLLRHWSATQPTIALSSAEAELAAIVRGASEALGMRSLMRDLHRDTTVQIWADASAAIGIVRRSGVGRVRHLDTRMLWIQQKVREGDLQLGKVDGQVNPADLFTKPLPTEAISEHCFRMSCACRTGRAATAPDVATRVLLGAPASMNAAPGGVIEQAAYRCHFGSSCMCS
jgi:hypothetical protein